MSDIPVWADPVDRSVVDLEELREIRDWIEADLDMWDEDDD